MGMGTSEEFWSLEPRYRPYDVTMSALSPGRRGIVVHRSAIGSYREKLGGGSDVDFIMKNSFAPQPLSYYSILLSFTSYCINSNSSDRAINMGWFWADHAPLRSELREGRVRQPRQQPPHPMPMGGMEPPVRPRAYTESHTNILMMQ